jgi:uncharacterized NAD(P)/FAD-binding protein YdhS
MRRRRVAIIGAGFSGAAVAAHLMKRGRAAPDVVLIERGQRFGPGLAYGTQDPAHLLNVRASNLSAFADQPDHFVKWLGGKDNAARFMPRTKYGAYIESVLRRASAGLFGAKLKRVRDTAIACRAENGGWVVTLAKGKPVHADAVVLALGNPPPAPLAVFEEAGVSVLDPWDARGLTALPKGDVLAVGAGLTMIDVALSLARRRKRGTIYAISRRGLAPRGHLKSTQPATPGATDLPLDLSDALHVLRKDVRAISARGELWQHAIDRLRARTPELWRRLPLEAQQRFLRHIRPWWDAHRHRTAPEVAKQVADLQTAGRLRVMAGEVVSVTPKGRHIEVMHRGRGSQARHRLDVVGVINCTGASQDPWTSKDVLVRQLLDEGIARAHPTALGFDVDVDGRMLDASGAPYPSLYAIGPITQGAFWESTAIPEIRVRAAALALMLTPED